MFEPLDFIARLAALAPRTRAHVLTYHGILATAVAMRYIIVPSESVKFRWSNPRNDLAAKK